MDVVGCTETSTWEWAWSNPHVDEALKADAKRIRAFGDMRGIQCLTCKVSQFPKDHAKAKQLTVVMMGMALDIATSEVAFFGVTGPMIYHLGLKNIRKSFRASDLSLGDFRPPRGD